MFEMNPQQATRGKASRSNSNGTTTMGDINGRSLRSAAVDDQRILQTSRSGAWLWQRQARGVDEGVDYSRQREGQMNVTKIAAVWFTTLVATPSNPPVNPTGGLLAGLADARPLSTRPAGYRQR